MTAYAITPPAQVTLPVEGTDEVFPVGRIFCIGRNYAEHAREMGHDPDREPPFFFMKPANAITTSGEFPYPPGTSDVHHEMEMIVALAKGGKDIAESDALDLVYGYGVGLDMTRRDLQGEAKKLGRPWEIGKAFDYAAPCSGLKRVADMGHPAAKARLTLSVNGKPRQDSTIDKMIWNVPETIAYISRYFELLPGDIIMTGTPEGVAAIIKGDTLVGEVEGVGKLEVRVV
jgi:fumarylpyruvate hydrolase